MKCINCGKEIEKIVIFNTSLYSLCVYISWKEDNKGLCLSCFRNENWE